MKDGGLSQRQLELLKLYAEGWNNKSIALKWHRSEKTVEYHRAQLFSIMKFKHFAHLVKTAVAFGLTSLCLMAFAGTVHLQWINPNVGQTNGVNIYYTTNIGTPTNQWTLLAYIPVSPPGNNDFTINLPPANYYFTCEFTNTFWGFSLPFSNGAATPQLPTNLLVPLNIFNR